MGVFWKMGIGNNGAMAKAPQPRMNFIDPFSIKGYVHWELIEDGKGVERGKGQGSQWYLKYIPTFIKRFLPFGTRNSVVNVARNRLATMMTAPSTTIEKTTLDGNISSTGATSVVVVNAEELNVGQTVTVEN